ncbi:MAG: TIGR02757 family protein [Myxococcota bacterium]
MSVGERLEELYAALDAPSRLAADPVAYPRRYAERLDREIAGVLASGLAYGRVAAFKPVLDQLFGLADAAGGPGAWVLGFDPERDGPALRPVYYRWNRGEDFILLLAALQRVVAEHGSLEPLVIGGSMVDGLERLVVALRAAAVAESSRCGQQAETFGQLPRGLRTLLPVPSDGSACKRWFLFLRWMIRPAREGIDLGVWAGRSPADLVVPLDTHVLRLAGFLGLTRRTDDSLRTALEITAALRSLDPDDPIRFDFALAHLGISGACKGARDPSVCPTCALTDVCVAP